MFNARRRNPYTASLRETLASLFYVHNETGNVYTHIAGFVIFVILAAFDGIGLPKTAECARTMFFAGVLAMAAGSSSYHLVRGMSNAFENVYACDLGGTIFMIALSCYHSASTARMTYTVIISMLCGLLLLLVPRLVRGAADLKDNWSLVKPLFCLHSFRSRTCATQRTLCFGWHFQQTTYGIGVTFMITKWPELRWPDRFDYWFQSHQIWHVCVVLGALGGREVRLVVC